MFEMGDGGRLLVRGGALDLRENTEGRLATRCRTQEMWTKHDIAQIEQLTLPFC